MLFKDCIKCPLFTIEYNVTNKIVLFIVVLFIRSNINSAIAQSKIVTESNQQWVQYYLTGKIGEKLSIAFDIGVRTKDNCHHLTTTLGRLSINYNFNKKLSAGIGFSNFNSYANSDLTRNEYRIHQEVLFKHNIARINFNERFRLEERYFISQPSKNSTFSYRARFRLQMTILLNHERLEANTFFIQLADEFFLNFGKQITYNFDQNRIIGGVGFMFKPTLSMSLSYVYQYAQKSAVNYELTNIFWITLNHTITLSSIKDEK